MDVNVNNTNTRSTNAVSITNLSSQRISTNVPIDTGFDDFNDEDSTNDIRDRPRKKKKKKKLDKKKLKNKKKKKKRKKEKWYLCIDPLHERKITKIMMIMNPNQEVY